MKAAVAMHNSMRFGTAWSATVLWAAVAAAQPAADDFGGGAPKPKTPAADDAAMDPIRRDPLVIRTIRDSKPTTPEQLILAAEATLDYDRPDESKRYLTMLLEKKPAAAALVNAQRQLGSGPIYRLALDERVQPEGKQVAEVVLKAASAAAFDPRRVESLVKNLNAPQPETRQQALDDLRYVGVDAAAPLLAALNQDSRRSEHARVQAALVELAPDLSGPLLAALDAPKPLLRQKVTEIAAQLSSREALYRLLRPALMEGPDAAAAMAGIERITGARPTLSDAQVVLERRVEQLLAGEMSGVGEDGVAAVWDWDRTKDAPRSRALPRTQAAVYAAARAAADLAALRPDQDRFRRLALLTDLEQRQIAAGLHAPLPAAYLAGMKKHGPELLSAVLDDAVRRARPAAMIAALQALAEVGDESLLAHAGEGVSRVVSLLRHTDRRVRYQALQTVVHWNPQRPFAGSVRVAEAIEYFVRSTGTPQVLIIYPREDYGLTLTGILGGFGYEGEAVVTPKQFMAQATTNPDYEFVLISDTIDHPTTSQLVEWMRKDYRTAELAVGVMGRAENYRELSSRYLDVPRTVLIPRLYAEDTAAAIAAEAQKPYLDPDTRLIYKAEDLKPVASTRPPSAKSTAYSQVQRIVSLYGPEFVPAEERMQQAYGAAELAWRIIREKGSAVRPDLGRMEGTLLAVLNRPDMTARVAPVLAEMGGPKVQTVLVDLASQTTFDLPARQAAAKAFAAAVEKRGILLKKEQILQQYDRYNRSGEADVGTQRVLGSLLDAVEARAKKANSGGR